MKVIIAGSRWIDDREPLRTAIRDSHFEITEVVCGGALGIDALGDRYAYAMHLPVRYFVISNEGKFDYTRLLNLASDHSNLTIVSDWTRDGYAAGPMRNEAMAKYADALIAVPLRGKRRGTDSMIQLARQYGLPMCILEVKEWSITTSESLRRRGL